jgi:hypothetical protein
LKGPSDTTTKLLDNTEEHLGIRNPRVIATARLLNVGSVAMHRSFQMLSSKSAAQYSTLFDWRHAANARFTMAGSLLKIIEYVSADYKRLKAEQTSHIQCRGAPP